MGVLRQANIIFFVTNPGAQISPGRSSVRGLRVKRPMQCQVLTLWVIAIMLPTPEALCPELAEEPAAVSSKGVPVKALIFQRESEWRPRGAGKGCPRCARKT